MKAVDSNDLPGGRKCPEPGADKTDNEDLKDLINARLARVQLGQKNPDTALATVAAGKAGRLTLRISSAVTPCYRKGM